MPDKWEYPWFAAWDLGVPHACRSRRIDPDFAKEQLLLLLREWYMHPNGQLPAYEFAFSDVNPPVHAWACWRVYKMTGAARPARPAVPRARLPEAADQLHLVGEPQGRGGQQPLRRRLPRARQHRRLRPLAAAARRRPLEQADGTAWMAFYCATMLSMALELAREDPAYEDVASKFFEHFVAIADAMNTPRRHRAVGRGGRLLLRPDLRRRPAASRCASARWSGSSRCSPSSPRGRRGRPAPAGLQEADAAGSCDNRPGPGAAHLVHASRRSGRDGHGHRLLAIPSRERLERVLRYVLDENEFLSPYGIRSLSRVHREQPFVLQVDGAGRTASTTCPGESDSGMFGGNSNWRGPVWFPVNYLLIEALERYHHFYGDTLQGRVPDRLRAA